MMKFVFNKTQLATIAGLACLMFCSVSSANQSFTSDPIRLSFGVYSSNKPSSMVKVFQPILKELEAKMTEKLAKTVDIRLQIAKDYEQGIYHLTAGKVDFSNLGPASYIEAKRVNPDLSILAVEKIDEEKVFYGIIATNKHTGINNISQLQGKSFAFGDESSTVGRFLAQLYLEQHGIRAGNLKSYEYLGRHDKVGTAVGAGDYEAGALNEATFKKLVDSGEPIIEIARFPNVTKPWIARSGLDPELFAALKESLLEITSAEALDGLKIDGFLEGVDSDFGNIRTAMENNALFFENPVESTEQTAVIAATTATATQTGTELNEAERSNPVLIAAHSTLGAETVSNPEIVSGEPLAATTTEPSPANLTQATTVHSKQADNTDSDSTGGRRITVNITLPSDYIDNMTVDENGTSQLTINVTIPESHQPRLAPVTSAEATDH